MTYDDWVQIGSDLERRKPLEDDIAERLIDLALDGILVEQADADVRE